MTTEGRRHTNYRNDLIDKLINMRINQHMTRLDIFKWLRDECIQQDGTIGFADSSVYEWMRWAKEETDRRAVQCFADDLKEDIERWEKHADDCLLEGDKKGYRECIKEIGKLKGHYVERQDITSANEPITEIRLIEVKPGSKKKPNTSNEDLDDFFKDL